MFDFRETIDINCDETNCLKKGATYFTNDKQTGKKLVVKFIANYNDQEDIKLISEFRKLILLSGEPEIGTVYFLAKGTIDGVQRSCYVMDFIEGKTLKEFINTKDEISLEEAIDIIYQIANGLEKAHHYGIFHHDLHSENIIIDTIGYVKIIDFLFRDINSDSINESITYDINSFRELTHQISEKCTSYKSLKILKSYIDLVVNFRGLSKTIKLLEPIIFDLSLINVDSKKLLSQLMYKYEESNFDQITVYKYNDVPIPEQFLEIVEEFSKIPNIEDKIAVQIECLRETEKYISNCVEQLLECNFVELDSLNLISWSIQKKNKGLDFRGPHSFNLDIVFKPKLINWIKLNQKIKFIEVEKEGLEESIFKNPLE